MLVLTREQDEQVTIELTPELMKQFVERGETIEIVTTVVAFRNRTRVRLGFDVPQPVPIYRNELKRDVDANGLRKVSCNRNS